MTTAARPVNEASCHWYSKDGTAVYEVPRASGEGMRPTTLADARRLSLLPSVTTILNVLAKPQLTTWLIEQSLLAALTTPRPPEEPLDAFIERVIHTERVQDQESDIAKKRGIEIHDAIEGYFNNRGVSDLMVPWVDPVITFLKSFGMFRGAERIVTSTDGYAGKTDLLQENEESLTIWDFKTTKNLPKSSYPEHILQCSAYANAINDEWRGGKNISTGNIYISTIVAGEFVVCQHGAWWPSYRDGFKPLLSHWQWAKNYHP